MSRSPLPAVTVALDPGTAGWSLRRLLRRTGLALGTPPLEPVLAVTRPFRLEDGAGLSAVRAAVEAAIPDGRWLAYDLDGFAAGPGGSIGLGVSPSDPLAATAAAIESALAGIAVPAPLPDERFLVPAARGLDRRALRAALRTLGLARPPWYRRLLAPVRARRAPSRPSLRRSGASSRSASSCSSGGPLPPGTTSRPVPGSAGPSSATVPCWHRPSARTAAPGGSSSSRRPPVLRARPGSWPTSTSAIRGSRSTRPGRSPPPTSARWIGSSSGTGAPRSRPTTGPSCSGTSAPAPTPARSGRRPRGSRAG